MKKFFRRLQKLFFFEQWSLLLCDSSLSIIKSIVPPKDRIWADPFIVEENGKIYIFIEEQFHKKNGRLAVIELQSDLSIKCVTPILEKDYHLSYPCVFQALIHGIKTWCMIPETSEHNAIELYTALEFPTKWKHETTLLDQISSVDTTPFFDGTLWWLFTSSKNDEHSFNNSLCLYYSENILGSWKAHPNNPVVVGRENSRMAGHIFTQQRSIFRPAQSCIKEYGEKIRIQEITALSPTIYEEKNVACIEPEKSLHAVCTHTRNESAHFIIRDIKTRRFRLFSHTAIL